MLKKKKKDGWGVYETHERSQRVPQLFNGLALTHIYAHRTMCKLGVR